MGLFSSETKEMPEPRIKETPWGPQARGFLTNLMTQNMLFPTMQTAGMSDVEKSGMGQLSNFVSGKSFQDPSESPYYLGLQRASKREEAEGASAIRRRANMGGMLNSSPAIKEEGDYRANMANNRLSLLGGLYNQERARDNPLTRAQAAMQYGGLPRQLEQQQMGNEYDTLMQQLLFPYQQQSQLAQMLMNYQPWYQPQFYEEPSGFSKLSSALGPVTGILGGKLLGGLGSKLSEGIAGQMANSGLSIGETGSYSPTEYSF